MLSEQNNLANTYQNLGRHEEALSIQRDVYSVRVKLNGEEHRYTLVAANNYAWGFCHLRRFEEAKEVLRKIMPVARRVLGESSDLTLRMRWVYARALFAVQRPRSPCGSTKKSPRVIAGTPTSLSGPMLLRFRVLRAHDSPTTHHVRRAVRAG